MGVGWGGEGVERVQTKRNSTNGRLMGRRADSSGVVYGQRGTKRPEVQGVTPLWYMVGYRWGKDG